MAFDFLKKFKKSNQPSQKPLKDKEIKKQKESVKEPSSTLTIKGHVQTLILKRPIITERASFLAGQRKYIFEVNRKTNKSEIKKAIESIWPVKVESVNIVNFHAKKVRLGKITSKAGAYKKAIVTLRTGYSIELLPR